MGIIQRLLARRNSAVADHFMTSTGQATWSDMSIAKAVKDGYRINVWVYRAIRAIAIAASSVPWYVANDGKEVEGHPLSKVLWKPNPRISRQTLFELLFSWHQLCGNAYLVPTKSGNKTTELWPCSPDRLGPICSPDPAQWIKGYGKPASTSVIYQPEEVIHFFTPDPANPIIGIGPLQAAARSVDTDVEQQNWNKAAMQNRGVLDGIFTFKREFKRLEDLEELTEKLNEKFTGVNGKRLGAIGSDASYIRIAATPEEMAFIEGRRFNREEILAAFGVPPQLVGLMESSTYNNYATSELIFWANTVIPLLDDFKDTLNFHLDSELSENEYIDYDTSGVAALRRAKLEQVQAAKHLSAMGVPFERLNSLFNFNIKEYEGWDKAFKAATQASVSTVATEEGTRSTEKRETAEELALQKEADAGREAKYIKEALAHQAAKVEEALQSGADIRATVEDNAHPLYEALQKIYLRNAKKYSNIQVRASVDQAVDQAISDYLAEEAIILEELSSINEATVSLLMPQIEDVLAQGLPVAAASQAITDIGVFSDVRALRIARTVVGTAASVGQLVSASESGATSKTWLTSGFEVRKEHQARSGETVGINERFSAQFPGPGPRFPGDPKIHAADRVNCRCSLTFS